MKKEASQKINEAVGILRKITESKLITESVVEEKEDLENLKKATVLLKEAAIALGSVGQRCPYCGGSGRIS